MKTQSIVVGFVVKAQRIVVECLRLDSGLPIITADYAQSLKAPSLRQQKSFVTNLYLQSPSLIMASVTKLSNPPIFVGLSVNLAL